MTLIVENQAYLDKVREFARSVGAEDELQKRLDFLDTWGGDQRRYRCRLWADHAPHSFAWMIEYLKDEHHGVWERSILGGLIYSGPGVPSDGSYPSFTVSLNPEAQTGARHMWSIHT